MPVTRVNRAWSIAPGCRLPSTRQSGAQKALPLPARRAFEAARNRSPPGKPPYICVKERSPRAGARGREIRAAETTQAASDDHMTMLQQANAHLAIAGIEAHKLAEQVQTGKVQLDHLAHHDVLTDLPNRILLQDRLSRAWCRTPPGRRSADGAGSPILVTAMPTSPRARPLTCSPRCIKWIRRARRAPPAPASSCKMPSRSSRMTIKHC